MNTLGFCQNTEVLNLDLEFIQEKTRQLVDVRDAAQAVCDSVKYSSSMVSSSGFVRVDREKLRRLRELITASTLGDDEGGGGK